MNKLISSLLFTLILTLSLSAQDIGVVCNSNVQLKKGWQIKDGYEITLESYEIRLQGGDSLKIIDSTKKKRDTYYKVLVLSGDLKDKEGWVWDHNVCTDQIEYQEYVSLLDRREKKQEAKENSLEYKVTNGISSVLGISSRSAQWILLTLFVAALYSIILGLIKWLSKGLGLIGLLERFCFSLTKKVFGGISTAFILAAITYGMSATNPSTYAHTFLWWIFPAIFFYSMTVTDWPVRETYSGSIGLRPVTLYGRIIGWHFGDRNKGKLIAHKILLLAPILGFCIAPIYIFIFDELSTPTSQLLEFSMAWITWPMTFGIAIGVFSTIIAHILPIPKMILKLSKPFIAAGLLTSFFCYIIVFLLSYFM